MKLESLAIIVPHNPILRGETDVSKKLQKVAKWLDSIGYKLKKISILEENDRSVAGELISFTQLYDIVFVFTHGDSRCVKQAIGNITSNIDVEKSVDNDRINNSWPLTLKVLRASNMNSHSVVYLQRIFIISLEIMDKQLDLVLRSHLEHYRTEPLYKKKFHVTINGLKKHIENLQSDSLCITLGKTSEGIDELTMSSRDFKVIVDGEVVLRTSLGANIIHSHWINSMSDLIYRSDDPGVKFSIEVIEKCFDEYGPENIFLSFNGGKDCTVLLHLVQTVLHRKYPDFKERKMFCLYVRSDNAFKEQDEFIEQCSVFYNLEVTTLNTNIKDALRIMINKNPQLKACFMGTRRTDPFCLHLNHFQMTDSDWPEIMRCSPFLDWHYSDIWDYLLYYKVPYCKLYDYGFTSLGNATNTIRNPSLLYDEDQELYLPAYKMLNEKKERSGRNVSKI